jgi:RNA polymerase sigma-70 factor, ECF subfamily
MIDSPDLRHDDETADAVVVARVLAGETEQYARLVHRYQRALYRHAVSMVLDHAAAADMVQDAFVRAYTNLKACRDHTRFRAWLFQTLRNRCLDHLKEPRRRHVRLAEAEPLFDPADGPDTLAERNEVRFDVTRALADLPADQREVFVMHYVDGMPYEAIAELLDASVSALKMRALRARQALSLALCRQDVTDEAADSSPVQTRQLRSSI